MKSFDKEVKIEAWVKMSNPEKVEAEFLESDWQEVFYDLEDLDDLVNHMILEVHNNPEEEFSRDDGRIVLGKKPEGYPCFIKPNMFVEKYVHKSEELGEIIIVFGDKTVDDEW